MRRLSIGDKITSRETDSFKQYLKDVSDIPLLTPEEEMLCTRKASKGDKTAGDQLVRANLRFVISVAKQYANSSNPIEDLVNEGNIGLMIAVEKFKPEMGFKFISYAVWWIRKIIIEHLGKNGRIVRLPANKINGLSKLDKKISLLEQKLSRPVDISEIISEFGSTMKQDEVKLLEEISVFAIDSLDKEVVDFRAGRSITLGEMIEDETCEQTDYLLVRENLKSEIEKILSILKPRERRVMIALYGLDGKQPMKLNELGIEFGVTRETIRQIKEKTLKNLKSRLKNSTIKNY